MEEVALVVAPSARLIFAGFQSQQNPKSCIRPIWPILLSHSNKSLVVDHLKMAKLTKIG